MALTILCEVSQLKEHKALLKECIKLRQEVNVSKARELEANQKFVDFKKENKKLQKAFEGVLKEHRKEICSKDQKISELKAKCNQLEELELQKANDAVHEGKKALKFSKSPEVRLEIKQEIDNERYKCSISKKDFGLKDCLKQHDAAAHEGKKAQKCSHRKKQIVNVHKKKKSYMNVQFVKKPLVYKIV